MKRNILILLIVLCGTMAVMAQPPQAFKYQAVVRDNSGEILQNHAVGVRISIHDATAGGTIAYQETFSETTNNFGLVNLEIGTGTPTIGTFTGIDWSSNSKFIETEIDPEGGIAYVSMGTSELLSVPFALYSDRSKDVVWEKSGNEIFYNDGKVGIGTSAPAGSLDVRGSGTDEGVVINLGNSDLSHKLTLFGGKETDPNPFLMWKDGDPFRFVTDAAGFSEKMRITSDGNVGIGTTTPGAILEVAGHIWQTGTGMSVFLGEGAGTLDDLSDNENIFIGSNAGSANTSGWRNTAIGASSIRYTTTGNRNTAIGAYSLCTNTTGNFNSAIGYKSLFSNTAGNSNTGTGYLSLNSNTLGSGNTAHGYLALYSNTIGISNVAIGNSALFHNTNRSNLVAVGDSALFNNGIGVVYTYEANQNTAIGSKALFSNTRGVHQTASGFESLYYNTTGEYNTAHGSNSLYYNTAGDYNTATGFQSLYSNTTGEYNAAHGGSALISNTTGDYNTACGFWSLPYFTIGDFNTAVGYFASVSGGISTSNSTGIGYNAQPQYTNRIMLGNTAITWIGGHSSWYNTSDTRVKNNVKEDVQGLDFILKLRPVTYHFDKDKMDQLMGMVDASDYAEKYDKEKIKQSGFLAQEVEQAAIDSGYDFSGVCKPTDHIKYYSLAYAEFVVPLVKAMQEQQVLIEELKSRIEKLERNK